MIIANLNPGIVDFLIVAIAKLRWDDANELPQTRVRVLHPYFQIRLLTSIDISPLLEVHFAHIR